MHEQLFERLGISPLHSGVCAGGWSDASGGELTSLNPANEQPLATMRTASKADYERTVAAAQSAFLAWRMVPPPQRGELVRQLGLALREHKADLGLLISLEVGKIRSEDRKSVV